MERTTAPGTCARRRALALIILVVASSFAVLPASGEDIDILLVGDSQCIKLPGFYNKLSLHTATEVRGLGEAVEVEDVLNQVLGFQLLKLCCSSLVIDVSAFKFLLFNSNFRHYNSASPTSTSGSTTTV